MKKSKLQQKLDKLKKKKEPKYRILSFDLAIRTGYCYGLELGQSGFFDNKARKDESNGFRLLRFEERVEEILKMAKPDMVVFERVSGHRVQAVKVQAGFQAILERLCLKKGLEYSAKSATEIKKFMTDKGNASKTQMVAAVNVALKKHGYSGDIKDDNEADAIALWMMVSDEFNKTKYGRQ